MTAEAVAVGAAAGSCRCGMHVVQVAGHVVHAGPAASHLPAAASRAFTTGQRPASTAPRAAAGSGGAASTGAFDTAAYDAQRLAADAAAMAAMKAKSEVESGMEEAAAAAAGSAGSAPGPPAGAWKWAIRKQVGKMMHAMRSRCAGARDPGAFKELHARSGKDALCMCDHCGPCPTCLRRPAPRGTAPPFCLHKALGCPALRKQCCIPTSSTFL